MRRCIGCYQSKPQSELVRFTYEAGEFRADINVRKDGRGIYLCRDTECLEKSIKRKAWNRICRCGVDAEEIRRVAGAALSSH